jgi:hypothetical protein
MGVSRSKQRVLLALCHPAFSASPPPPHSNPPPLPLSLLPPLPPPLPPPRLPFSPPLARSLARSLPLRVCTRAMARVRLEETRPLRADRRGDLVRLVVKPVAPLAAPAQAARRRQPCRRCGRRRRRGLSAASRRRPADGPPGAAMAWPVSGRPRKPLHAAQAGSSCARLEGGVRTVRRGARRRTVGADPRKGRAGLPLVVVGLSERRARVGAHARGALVRLGGPGLGRALEVVCEDGLYGGNDARAPFRVRGCAEVLGRIGVGCRKCRLPASADGRCDGVGAHEEAWLGR